MREILFRGKRKDNGEWIEGHYIPVCFGSFPCKPAIVPDSDGAWEPFEILPECVLQYTGTTDKHNKKIFEHDIIKYFSCEDGQYIIGKIVFENLAFKIYWAIGFKDVKSNLCDYSSELLEVVGNIYDNPELLEVE